VWSLKAHNGLIGRLMFTSDGQRFVSVSNDGTARIWDSRLDGESVLLRSHVNYISDMRISADGRFAVTGSHDQTASVWDLATVTERKVLGSHETYVTSVAISPDNRLVLTGSGQFGKPGFVRLWEIESGKELKRLKGHENLVSCVAFSRDGRLLGSGARGGIIKVWDADSGAELRSMNAPGDWPVDLAFSKDGKQIITRDVTDRWSAWDVTTGQPVDVEERPAAPDVIRDSNGSLFLTRSDSELRVVRRKPTGEVWRESSDRLAAWEPSWCERDATRYENAKNWLAAHFYLRRLSELKPEDEAVRSRLAHVVSMLEAETREEDRAAQGANDALPSQDQ
jgi:WD40 repeat protein